MKDEIQAILDKYTEDIYYESPEGIDISNVKLVKKELADLFSLHVVVSSNMRKALETVVKGYESDGMENMQIRDDVFYKTCKEALNLGK